jgi:alanine-glyoxylate transaminase/serine-glyoxylate transaminase/serine-pyruvate transaminase
VIEEGREARFRRHRVNAAALQAGILGMGLGLAAQDGFRLPQLTTVAVPSGVDEATVRAQLLEMFNIEIGAGLGPLKGKVWRVGLMGESCKRGNVMLFLSALETILESMGFEIARGKSLAAADRVYGGSLA